MALFKPYKITSDKLEDLAIQEGQIIITIDTKKLYVDISATERIEVTSDAEVDLSDYVTEGVLTQALAEETSEREKQDELLSDSIAGKADVSHRHSAADITSGTLGTDRLPSIPDSKISAISASKLIGTIPSANLPSYVDDVIEGETTADFPEEGESGKIYVATSTNKTYRWGGSSYVEISASLALGTTSSTAFRGDYGNTAYQHATAKGAAFGSGLYKITTNAQGHVTAATAVTKNDITALGIPAQDTNTTYSAMKGATSSAAGSAGLVPAPAAGKQTSFLRGDGTWVVPTNTTYSNMTGATASAAGKAGLVPAPAAGAATRYLRSDGTWQVPPDTNTTYTLSSFGITATAAELNKLDGLATTKTELGYLDGVTSNVQTQLNGKLSTSGTAAAATKLATARTIGLSGDASGSVSFNGTANVSIPATVLHHSQTAITANSNLNSYTDPGWYYCAANATAQTLTNCPTDNAFTMIVTTHAGTNQVVIEYMASSFHIWTRNYYNNTWGSWAEVYTTIQKPTASEIGAAASSHSHNAATTSAAGFLPKLGGGTTNFLRADGTWAKPPDTNTTYSQMTGATSSAAGKTGLVPAPAAGYQSRYLRGDGAWATVTASSANQLTTARTFALTGDVTGSATFNGTANCSIATTLAANSVTANEIASGAVGLSELSSAVGTVAVQSATPTDSHVKLWIKV